MIPPVQKKVEPVVQEPKKNIFTNMFGDSAPKKEPEIVKPLPPSQPQQNKDINTWFGPSPSQKVDIQPTKSPVIQKKEMNFDFESAWKAE